MDSMRWSEEIVEPSSSAVAVGGGGGAPGGGNHHHLHHHQHHDAAAGVGGGAGGGGAGGVAGAGAAGHADGASNNGGSNALLSSASHSSSAPTIKNHSVTHLGNYLFCFGGYDGRRNHMTLLLYDLRSKRWIRPIPVSDPTNHLLHLRSPHHPSSIHGNDRRGEEEETVGMEPAMLLGAHQQNPPSPFQRRQAAAVPPDFPPPNMMMNMNMMVEDGDGEDNAQGGINRVHHHHHRQHHSVASSNSSAIYVFGNPPPGRNGHSATLAPNDDDDDDDDVEDEEDDVDDEEEEGGGGSGSRSHSAGGGTASRIRRRGGGPSNSSSNGRIIIIGGWLGTGPLAASDMHVLDVSRGGRHLTWYQPPARGQPPGPCNMHSADYIRHLRSVYVFRGGNGREYLNDLHALNVDTYVWRPVETRGPAPQQRANHSSAVLEETSELFIFGGWNGGERLNDIHILNTATSTWTRPRVGGVLPHPRAGMTLTALRGRLYLFGGSGTSAKCFQDLQILDRQQMAWLDVAQQDDVAGNQNGHHHHQQHGGGAPNPHSPHRNHPLALAAGRDGSLFRFGGALNESLQQQQYGGDDISHNHAAAMMQVDSHQPQSSSSSSSRPTQDGSSSVLRQNSFRDWRLRDTALLSGSSITNRAQNGPSFSLSPSSSSTINPNDEDVPPTVLVHGRGPGRRAGHTATAVHRKIYVFGGSCGSDYLNDFYVLDTDPPPHATVTESTTLQLLERRLGMYFNDPEFADVVFVVQGGHKVYGHKMILSMVSDCFRAMFTTGFRETSEGEIEIPDCTHAGFLALMEYVYTSRLPRALLDGLHQESAAMQHSALRAGGANPSSYSQSRQQRYPCPNPSSAFARIVEILELADRFFLDHLKQICETLLQSVVNAETVEYLLGVSQKTNAVQLQAICEHFVRNHE